MTVPSVEQRDTIADLIAKRIKAMPPEDTALYAVGDFYRHLMGLPERGDDDGPLEGFFGRAATESTPKRYDPGVAIDWTDFSEFISPNFTVGEYLCYDARRVPENRAVKEWARCICGQLEAIRAAWGSGLMITSGYRPEAINAEVGGVRNSQHIEGHAVDIAPVNGAIHDFQEWLDVRWAGALGYGADRGFVHIDMRHGPEAGFSESVVPAGVRWVY